MSQVIETDFFLALSGRCGNFHYLDVMKKQPLARNSFIEIISLLSHFDANLDNNTLLFIPPNEANLAQELQIIGFNFLGYLDNIEPIDSFNLIGGIETARVVPINEWLTTSSTSKFPIRIAFKFSGTLNYDFRVGAKFNIDFFRTRERYITGLTDLSSYISSASQKSINKFKDVPRAQDSFSKVIKNRKSADHFDGHEIPLDAINGMINDSYFHQSNFKRPFASAGGIGRHNLLLIAKNIGELQSGLYQLDEKNPSWVRQSFEFDIHHFEVALFSQPIINNSSAILVLSHEIEELIEKYGTRALRFAFLNSGALMQQLHLSATSRDLSFRIIGGFDDFLASRLLGINTSNLVVTGLCLIG